MISIPHNVKSRIHQPYRNKSMVHKKEKYCVKYSAPWIKSYWQVHRLICQVTFKVMLRAHLKHAVCMLSLLGVLVRGSFTNQMPGLTSWVLFKSLWSMSLRWGAWPQRDKKNTVYTIHGVGGSLYVSCLSRTHSQQQRQWPHAPSSFRCKQEEQEDFLLRSPHADPHNHPPLTQPYLRPHETTQSVQYFISRVTKWNKEDSAAQGLWHCQYAANRFRP